MKKFEYMQENLGSTILNELGLEGWELCGVVHNRIGIFKREKDKGLRRMSWFYDYKNCVLRYDDYQIDLLKMVETIEDIYNYKFRTLDTTFIVDYLNRENIQPK